MDVSKHPSVDLAKGTFVEKWPSWIRWLLFIPASIIAPIIFIIVQNIFSTWFLDLGPNAFYYNLLRGIVYGGGVVFVGAVVAPRKQNIVALILLIIIAIITGMAFLVQFQDFVLNEFLEELVTLIAAGYATYYVFKAHND